MKFEQILHLQFLKCSGFDHVISSGETVSRTWEMLVNKNMIRSKHKDLNNCNNMDHGLDIFHFFIIYFFVESITNFYFIGIIKYGWVSITLQLVFTPYLHPWFFGGGFE